MTIKEFGSTAQGLARNPLGIIALFIVLIYGFACLVVGASDKLETAERQPIIWFMVCLPLIVLFVFGWLVRNHHKKLYAPSDFKDESHFLKSMGSELANLSPALPNTNGNSHVATTADDWTKLRDSIYAENKGYFIVHVLEPSQKKGQEYEIFIYLLRHKSKDYTDIEKAEFFFGSYWGNKIYVASKSGDYLGVKTSAYGPFLAVCRVTFKDGTSVVLNKYIDFEMGFAVKAFIGDGH